MSELDLHQQELAIQSERVDKLLDFINHKIIPNHALESSKAIGRWRPLYHDEQETMIPYLTEMFGMLKTRIDSSGTKRPILLECGAGYNEIAATAAIAGFNVKAIEVQEKISKQALEYQHVFEQQGIIPPGSIETIHGSYYLKESWDTISQGIHEQYKAIFAGEPVEQIHFLSLAQISGIRITRENRNTITLKDIQDNFRSLDTSVDALRNVHLVDEYNKLNVDCVFGYVSDPFALETYGFLEQMRDILPSGGRLALIANQFTIDAANMGKFNGWVKEPSISRPSLPILEIWHKP